MEIGAKVYMWNFYEKDVAKSVASPHDPIIGEVVGFKPSTNPDYNEVKIKSVIDGRIFSSRLTHVFEVGTGPAIPKHETIYEDYYV